MDWLSKMEAEVGQLELEIEDELLQVKVQIDKLELEIKDVEADYKSASTDEERQFQRGKLSYLWDKEQLIWKEKQSIRDKEKVLLDMKKVLLEKELQLKVTACSRSDNEIMKRLERIESGMYATLWLSLWGELSSTVTSETTEQFRTNLVKFYGDETDQANVNIPEWPLRCMVTDLRLPGKWITAAHLLARKDSGKAHIFGIQDINDPRNGLLWFRAIEEAFSVFQLVFSWDEDANTFVVHVLNASLCNQKISEMELRKKVNRSLDHFLDPNTKEQFESLTFADLEGKSITFNNLNRPYKRVLSLHAKLGIHKAKLEEKLPPQLELDRYNFDYWTEALESKLLHQFLKDTTLD